MPFKWSHDYGSCGRKDTNGSYSGRIRFYWGLVGTFVGIFVTGGPDVTGAFVGTFVGIFVIGLLVGDRVAGAFVGAMIAGACVGIVVGLLMLLVLPLVSL